MKTRLGIALVLAALTPELAGAIPRQVAPASAWRHGPTRLSLCLAEIDPGSLPATQLLDAPSDSIARLTALTARLEKQTAATAELSIPRATSLLLQPHQAASMRPQNLANLLRATSEVFDGLGAADVLDMDDAHFEQATHRIASVMDGGPASLDASAIKPESRTPQERELVSPQTRITRKNIPGYYTARSMTGQNPVFLQLQIGNGRSYSARSAALDGRLGAVVQGHWELRGQKLTLVPWLAHEKALFVIDLGGLSQENLKAGTRVSIALNGEPHDFFLRVQEIPLFAHTTPALNAPRSGTTVPDWFLASPFKGRLTLTHGAIRHAWPGRTPRPEAAVNNLLTLAVQDEAGNKMLLRYYQDNNDPFQSGGVAAFRDREHQRHTLYPLNRENAREFVSMLDDVYMTIKHVIVQSSMLRALGQLGS